MKFIVHNLRMIRARLRSNGWVLAELFLVFIVMWFLCDSLGCLKYTFYRPLGYNIDHVSKNLQSCAVRQAMWADPRSAG